MTLSERFWMRLAWLLPRGLVYWAATRCAVNASAGKWSGVEVPGVTVVEMLQRWER